MAKLTTKFVNNIKTTKISDINFVNKGFIIYYKIIFSFLILKNY